MIGALGGASSAPRLLQRRGDPGGRRYRSSLGSVDVPHGGPHPVLVAAARTGARHGDDLLRRLLQRRQHQRLRPLLRLGRALRLLLPDQQRDAALNVVWALANYGVIIAITPIDPPGGSNVVVHHFVITLGTLVTAATLLTYLRGRVERLLGRLTDAASTDPLTGLPNRVAFHEILESELERAQPDGRPVSVLILDLDRFKRINERLGLAAGDRALRAVSSLLDEIGTPDRLRRAVRRRGVRDRPARDDSAPGLPVRRGAARQAPRDSAAPGMKLRASAGVAIFPDHGSELATLTAAADRALHAAKALGRDRAVIYSPEVTSALGAVAGRRNVETPGAARHGAQPRRGAGPARLRHRQAHPDRRAPLRDDGARARIRRGRVERLRLAGILHDIGKIGVPDSILRKPGPLTDEEMDQMRRHPELGRANPLQQRARRRSRLDPRPP